jgi:hypothetical protein
MGYSDGAWERAMKMQEVILRALSGEGHWLREDLGSQGEDDAALSSGIRRSGGSFRPSSFSLHDPDHLLHAGDPCPER